MVHSCFKWFWATSKVVQSIRTVEDLMIPYGKNNQETRKHCKPYTVRTCWSRIAPRTEQQQPWQGPENTHKTFYKLYWSMSWINPTVPTLTSSDVPPTLVAPSWTLFCRFLRDPLGHHHSRGERHPWAWRETHVKHKSRKPSIPFNSLVDYEFPDEEHDFTTSKMHWTRKAWHDQGYDSSSWCWLCSNLPKVDVTLYIFL